MKKLYVMPTIALSLLISISTSFAANEITNKNVSILCHYYSPNQFGKLTENTIQNIINLSDKNKNQWNVIGGIHSTTQSDIFILLGKIEKINSDNVKIKFLTVGLNTNRQHAQEAAIILPYGKHGQIAFDQDKSKIKIYVVVG